MFWKDVVLRLRALFFRRRMDEELREELQFHLEMQARKNLKDQPDPAEARRRARLQFGGVERATEECRDQRGISAIDILVKDVIFSLRMLRKSPGFTVVAVATLALAIGANAVAFGALNALILRPLNVPQADSLYAIQPRIGNNSLNVSYPNYLDLRDRNRTFDGLAAYSFGLAGLDTGENPARVWIYEVSGNYFDVLRIQPYLGRFFHSSDEHGANSAPYVVLTYAYWHTHFQEDRGVVGRRVLVNKHPFTIIGVAPPGFHGTLLFSSADFFVPMVNEEQIEGSNYLNARGNGWIFMTMGHLKPGVAPAQAIADLNSIGSYLKKTYPKEEGILNFALARPNLYGDYLGRPVRAFLTALTLLAVLILLAACANLGSLFTARATDRSREVALRLALGAGRLRILRQLFTEALLISLMGGAAGLWGSVVLLRWLSAWQPFPQVPVSIPVEPDANVYLAALLLALASGFLFGAVPVKQILQTDPYGVIKSGSTGTVGRRITARDFLLVAQIAICALLVTSSMVAVRGLVSSLHGNFGFEPRNAMLVNTDLNMAGYRGDAVRAMQKRMIDAMGTIPGVKAVGLVDWAPLSMQGWYSERVFTDKTTDLRPSNAAAQPSLLKVSPDYFRAAGTALLQGRDVTWQDDEHAPRVAVVNQEFAREIFGSITGPIGRYYKLMDGTRIQVVGIVEDGKFQTLTEAAEPAMFFPLLQSPSSSTFVVVRSNEDPAQLAPAIRSKLRDLDPGLPSIVQTWKETMVLALFPSRVATVSLGILGLMGAMLSITGIFGMAAYSVSKRKRELGIRIALGAQRKEVLQAALGHAVRLLAFGAVAGLLLGILASRVLAHVVFEATPRDPLVLAGVVLAMSLLGLLATWIPAQRALSIDPAMLMREE
jgi:predicted permease